MSDAIEYVVWIAAALVAVFAALLFAILNSLPKRLQSDAVGDDVVDPAVLELAAEFQRLGFERCGAVLHVNLATQAWLVPLIHRRERCFAVVYQLAARPHDLIYDVVSLLETDQSGLTTGMTHEAGIAPAWPGSLRQILVGASPDVLVNEHREAVRHLSAAGLSLREIGDGDLIVALRESFRLQRRVFTRKPVRSVCRALWRTLTRRNPHLGRLDAQEIARRQIRAIRDGLWPEPSSERERVAQA